MDEIIIHVAVGLVLRDNTVLVAKRHAHQHQGGLWEFPGGKIEPGETPLCALKRELKEEVNIDAVDARYVFSIRHAYVDKVVELIVFEVTSYYGEAQHREGQILKWLPLHALHTIEVPAANQDIIQYLSLTSYD